MFDMTTRHSKCASLHNNRPLYCMMSVENLYLGTVLVASAFAGHGWRKGSLSESGAIAAWITGYAHMANPLYVFAVSLIVFYVIGSKATKVQWERGSLPLTVRSRPTSRPRSRTGRIQPSPAGIGTGCRSCPPLSLAR